MIINSKRVHVLSPCSSLSRKREALQFQHLTSRKQMHLYSSGSSLSRMREAFTIPPFLLSCYDTHAKHKQLIVEWRNPELSQCIAFTYASSLATLPSRRSDHVNIQCICTPVKTEYPGNPEEPKGRGKGRKKREREKRRERKRTDKKNNDTHPGPGAMHDPPTAGGQPTAWQAGWTSQSTTK